MPSAGSSKSNKKIAHYRLDKLLAEPMAGAIYLAHNEKDNQTVFLTTLQADAARSSDLVERFQRRAETLAQLEHEALLPLLDYGIDGKRPFAIMAYLPGQFLSEQLEDSTETTDAADALSLIKQLAVGLAKTHPAGLIHHDLRPENIYIGESGHPYLLDLTIPPTPAALTQFSGSIKELDYQSPEQIQGKALSGRSNIYSLGILLYRLLAGQKPALPVSEWDIFEHKGIAREVPLNKVRKGLSAATYDAVRNCIWQKEWSRFETAEALIAALDKALEKELAGSPPPPPIWIRFFHWLRQPKVLQFAVPAIIFLFILILAFALMRGRAARRRNVTPTPNTAVLPLETEADTAVIADPESTPTPTSLPSKEPTSQENPAVLSSPTKTAVPATATNPPATETATPTAKLTQTVTTTPTPTETNCTISPPFGWARYEIQASDSLFQLAQVTGTTVERLQEVNCLETILLSVGQKIWLPFLPVSPTPTASATPLQTATATETETAVPTNPPPPPAPTNPPPTPPTPTPPTAPTPLPTPPTPAP